MQKSSGHTLLRVCRTMARRRRKSLWMVWVKAVTFQMFAVTMTFLLAFLVTHDVDVSMFLSGFDILFKIVLYVVFDVSWSRRFTHFQE